MNRFLVGLILGGIAGALAAIWLAPVWAALVGLGFALIVWLRIYKIDIPDINLFD